MDFKPQTLLIMNTTLFIFVIVLMALCVLLMRRILKLEYQVFDLNDKLNISDYEYISLFGENRKLSKTIDTFAEIRHSESWYSDEIEKRMNIIGQNGNDGKHYKNEKL